MVINSSYVIKFFTLTAHIICCLLYRWYQYFQWVVPKKYLYSTHGRFFGLHPSHPRKFQFSYIHIFKTFGFKIPPPPRNFQIMTVLGGGGGVYGYFLESHNVNRKKIVKKCFPSFPSLISLQKCPLCFFQLLSAYKSLPFPFYCSSYELQLRSFGSRLLRRFSI